MELIECSKCKIKIDEVYAQYPEKCDDICICGRVYKIKPTWVKDSNWVKDSDHTHKLNWLWFCETCGFELEELKEIAFKKIISDYIQPERSKREDLHHKDCIPLIKHNCWHGYANRHNCEFKEDCDNIVGARMRCSEHCGNTVRGK